MSATKFFVSALSVAACVAVAAPAAARDRDVVVTATSSDDVMRQVAYRDLNLASISGEQALVYRVKHAVGTVCLDAVGGSSGYLTQSSINCKTRSWNGAAPQIGRAVQRARDLAANGWSAIAPVAITISAQ